MAKHRKHIRRWPKLTAIAVALSAFVTAAVLPVAGANANTPAPQPTCTETECVWLMTESPEAYDWMAMPNASAIWIDMQSQAAPWLEPVRMRAQLRDSSHSLLIYFSGASTNAAIGSLNIFRVNAELVGTPDSFGFDQSYVTNVTLEQPELSSGTFVRIQQAIAQSAVAPQPTASPTPIESQTPTPTSSSAPAATSTPESAATTTPEASANTTPPPTLAPVSTSQPVASPAETAIKPEPAATAYPTATADAHTRGAVPGLFQDSPQPPAPPTPFRHRAKPARVAAQHEPVEHANPPSNESHSVAKANTEPIADANPRSAGLPNLDYEASESPITASQGWLAAGVTTAAVAFAAISGAQLTKKRGSRWARRLKPRKLLVS